MGLADDADNYRALLYGFLGVFDLKDAALRRAMAESVDGLVALRCGHSYKVTESLS